MFYLGWGVEIGGGTHLRVIGDMIGDITRRILVDSNGAEIG